MIDLKPYGAFVEHTIRPMLSEFKWVLDEFEKNELKLTESNLEALGSYLMKMYAISLVSDIVKTIVTVGSVCLVAYLVLR